MVSMFAKPSSSSVEEHFVRTSRHSVIFKASRVWSMIGTQMLEHLGKKVVLNGSVGNGRHLVLKGGVGGNNIGSEIHGMGVSKGHVDLTITIDT